MSMSFKKIVDDEEKYYRLEMRFSFLEGLAIGAVIGLLIGWLLL